MSMDYNSVNFYPDYQYSSYNPKKGITKAGFIGASIGLAAGAGLQYGIGEILYKNSGKLSNNFFKAMKNGNNTLARIYAYLMTCALNHSDKTTKWCKVGIAGAIGATIAGLAAALCKAKKNLQNEY